jgi:hypothetical protein
MGTFSKEALAAAAADAPFVQPLSETKPNRKSIVTRVEKESP